MTISASVAFFKSDFVAALSDGRRIERHGWREMAQALYEVGVEGGDIEYQWHNGQRMITAGQQVALKAEIRRLAHTSKIPPSNDHAVAA
jgi:hypothetical protein